MDYFGEADPHARQYSLVAQSLLKITTAHAKKRELQLRLKRRQASSDLFGLIPAQSHYEGYGLDHNQARLPSESLCSHNPGEPNLTASAPLDWTIYDAEFFALPWPNENDQGLQDFLQPGTHTLDGASVADIPLFPVHDQQTDSGLFSSC